MECVACAGPFAHPPPNSDRSTRNGWNDADFIGGRNRRVEIIQKPDVFVIHINIDKSSQVVAIKQTRSQVRVIRSQAVENFTHSGTRRICGIVATGMRAERSWDSNEWHVSVHFLNGFRRQIHHSLETVSGFKA